jgi:two-component system sensor histidine kinase FlrB
MPKLPTTRQTPPGRAKQRDPEADRKSLARAFLTFTQAAGSLEKSYAQLQNEVSRLRAELESANEELSLSLEENSRVRTFLSRILEELPCGVLVTDKDSCTRLLNPSAKRLLNLEAMSTSTQGARNEQLDSEIVENLRRAIAAGNTAAEIEWACVGEKRAIEVAASKLGSQSETDSDTIWILRDISDQKRLAEERETAKRVHALAEISTVLAHEIRNPLASMELFAGLLARVTDNMPEANEWTLHLQSGLRSLSATVNNVLQFHTQPQLQRQPVDIAKLLKETADFLSPLARQRGIGVRVMNEFADPTVPAGAMVHADVHRLQQVFFNLMLNAFRAMSDGGTLTIEIVPGDSDGELRTNFRDNGCGIEESAIGRIFEPGFTTKAGSPGLGLSVCRKTVEQHGGRIEAKSIPADGTTFSIFLPRWKGHACS